MSLSKSNHTRKQTRPRTGAIQITGIPVISCLIGQYSFKDISSCVHKISCIIQLQDGTIKINVFELIVWSMAAQFTNGWPRKCRTAVIFVKFKSSTEHICLVSNARGTIIRHWSLLVNSPPLAWWQWNLKIGLVIGLQTIRRWDHAVSIKLTYEKT